MKRKNILIPDEISGPKVTWRDRLNLVANHIPFWTVAVAAVLVILTVFIVRNVKRINAESETVMLCRELLPDEYHLLNGVYCVRNLTGETDRCLTALIDGSGEEYGITIYSEYAPETLNAHLMQDGKLFSESLGEGVVSYKPYAGTVIIVFSNGGREMYEFSK